MEKIKNVKEFVEKLDNAKKVNPKDLSSDQDLTIGIMNLISIEEHLMFSGAKTGKKEFYDLTKDVENGKSLVFEIFKSNKLKPGFSVPAFLRYGKGLICRWNYLYQLIKLDAIRKNGSYYSLFYEGEEIKAQGIISFVKELEIKGLMTLEILEELISEYEPIDVLEEEI